MGTQTKKLLALMVVDQIVREMILVCSVVCTMCHVACFAYSRNRVSIPRSIRRVQGRIEHLNRLIGEGDRACIEQLRMDRRTFGILCDLVRTVGRLDDSKYMSVEEMVAMSLHLLGHHVKNRVIKYNILRSGEAVSMHFYAVLKAVIRLHGMLLKTPEPVPVNSTDETWKWFKNCLGALDCTHIRVRVSDDYKARYKTREGEIATNVLGVCSPDMQFIYVLSGWEGSALDSRVLRDALIRRNGLKIDRGMFYLVDADYENREGFLAPYRYQRYHVADCRDDGAATHTPEEFFNMKHAAARNVIDKCFGLLKLRWAILRSRLNFPIKTQNCIILACCLIQNLIRREMPVDPLEEELGDTIPVEDVGDNVIDAGEASGHLSVWRNQLATDMFNEWMMSKGQVHATGQNNDTELIQRTCKTTKYYDLCVSSLKSNSSSLKADCKGLAVIMIRIGMANATSTNSYLSFKALSTTNDTIMKRVLKECADKYSYAGEALQASLQELAMESYDYAYMQVMAAADYPNACHNGFRRYPGLAYPPDLGPREEGLKHICDVVLGIIDTLGW